MTIRHMLRCIFNILMQEYTVFLVCALADPETKRYSMTTRPYVTLLKFGSVNKWQIDNIS